MRKSEMLDGPWFNLGEESQSLGDTAMSEGFAFKTYSCTPIGSRRHNFYHDHEKYICEGAPAYKKRLGITVLGRPVLNVGIGSLLNSYLNCKNTKMLG